MAKADFPKAKAEFPSTGMDVDRWIEVFDRNPDVMWSLIADIFNAVKDEEERAAGIRRMGRRPMRAASSMAEVYAAVFPQQYSTEPFPQALAELIGTRSQRQFAMKVPVNQSVISRLLSGETQPDLQLLEAIAAAAKVPPHFFVEYRALLIGEIFRDMLLAQPNLGIAVMKRMRAMQ